MHLPRVLISIAAAVAAASSPAFGAPAPGPVEQAEAAIQAGEFTHAEDLLTPLVGRGRTDAAALYDMGVVRMAQKRYGEAVDFCERATKANPTKVEYFAELGLACNGHLPELGPLDADAMATRMRKAYEKALKIDPQYRPALLGLVHFYEHAPELIGGSIRKAREFAERLRKLDPYNGELELGRLAAADKNFEEALVHYDAAVKLRPDDVATATASGWTLFKLGRKDQARARFEAVLKQMPDFEPAKMGLAETAPPAQ